MLFTLEHFTKEAYNNQTFNNPSEVIKSLFLGWQYSDYPTKLNGMERGNNTDLSLVLIQYFIDMEKSDIKERATITKELLDITSSKNYAELIEELFEGWLSNYNANIGGEYDLNIYKEKNKIIAYFNQLNTSLKILPLLQEQELKTQSTNH